MATTNASGKAEPSVFPKSYVWEPSSAHTHTAVILHGRGSNATEFASELSTSTCSGNRTLRSKFPGWRWVFPCAKELWSVTFEEEMPAWFEAYSLTDINARQDLQMSGIRESVEHVNQVLEHEIEVLGGRAENIILGGISQGAAVAMWTLLCQRDPKRQLGAFFGASTWLPFAENIEGFLGQECIQRRDHTDHPTTSESDIFIQKMLLGLKESLVESRDSTHLLLTPVFIGHGVDDAYVDIDLGRRAIHTLTTIGLKVVWKEYSGAEEEGHWFKVPEEMDDLVEFLSAVIP